MYQPDTNELIQIDNSDDAIVNFCSQLEKTKRSLVVFMQGAGGHEYLPLRHLARHSLDAVVINPKSVRDFAKGVGLDSKNQRKIEILGSVKIVGRVTISMLIAEPPRFR